MATDVGTETTKAEDVRPGGKLYRVSVAEYQKMLDAGAFRDSANFELIAGLFVNKMTKNDPHDSAVSILGDSLRAILPPGWIVREEKSMILSRWSRLEPDLVVARGTRQDYRDRAPSPADVPLIIEVADSSYHKDHGPKLRRYAAAKVAIYWIVNLPLRRIEVYRDPVGKGRAAKYREVRIFDQTSVVPVVVEGRDAGQIAVGEFLP